MDIFEQQNAFVAMMIEAYKKGEINAGYKPYMDWKQGFRGHPIGEEVEELRALVSKDLDYYYDKYPESSKEIDFSVYLGEYKGYKEDAEIVAILEAIDAELINLHLLNR